MQRSATASVLRITSGSPSNAAFISSGERKKSWSVFICMRFASSTYIIAVWSARSSLSSSRSEATSPLWQAESASNPAACWASSA